MPVRITDEVRRGAVGLPHGHGHSSIRSFQRVSSKMPGVSVNDWTDERDVDSIVGQSILNGVLVKVRAASADESDQAAG